MKKLFFILLIAGSLSAQKQVFNVQQYCIDEKPFKRGSFDIKGNEYSFVFLDTKKEEVVFFLTQMKLKYHIVSTNVDEGEKEYTNYVLKGNTGLVDMRINRSHTKIEFLYPDKHIYLMVGATTKMPASLVKTRKH